MTAGSIRNTKTASKIVKLLLATQPVEPGVSHYSAQQPRTPIPPRFFQAGKRPVSFSQSGIDRRNRHLRDVLSMAKFMELLQYSSRFVRFFPEGKGRCQGRQHQSAVTGKLGGPLQCDYGLRILPLP